MSQLIIRATYMGTAVDLESLDPMDDAAARVRFWRAQEDTTDVHVVERKTVDKRLPDPTALTYARCDAFSTDDDVCDHQRDDGWRCGVGKDEDHRHTLFSADGEWQLMSSGWYVPKHRKAD